MIANKATDTSSRSSSTDDEIGNGATWGFGTTNGAPGLSSAQGRQPGPGTNSSFAQTIGGSQPATPLDLSEFPSLSGTSQQPNYQNPGQAVWANQRTVQHTPVQRPQQQNIGQQQSSVQQQPQSTSQVQESGPSAREDMFSTASQFAGNDDYHHGGQGGVGQLGGSSHPQPGSIEEFPPLGRNGTDEIQHDRRGSLMQSAAFGGFSNPNAFSLPPTQSQTRHGLPNAPHSQRDGGRSSLVDRVLSHGALGFGGASSTTRSPADSLRQGQNSSGDHDKASLPTPRISQQNNMNALLSSFQDHHIGSSSQSTQPQSQSSRQQQHGLHGPSAAQTAESTPLDQMTPIEEWGLPGLLARIRSDDPNISGMAIGQDLTTLGLDLNSPEPLYPTWNGPFAPAGARPLQPRFHLPECYTVSNVHNVREKLGSFSDETLMYIFYTEPKDIMQELAATELTHRNWRYHKVLQAWLTKDQIVEPMQVSPGTERGSYIFFNQGSWQRMRQDFLLNYEDLDDHIPSSGNGNGNLIGQGNLSAIASNLS